MSQFLFLMSPALLWGQAEPPRFDLHTTSVNRTICIVHKMNADGDVTIQDQSMPVPGHEVVALRRHSLSLPAWPRVAHCVLSSGDRIVGTPVEIAGAVLHFKAGSLRDNKDETREMILRLPVTRLSVLWVRSPESIDVDRFPAVFAENRKIDQIVLRNGDIVSGTVTGLDAGSGEIQIESGTGKRTIAMNKVVVISFSNRVDRSRKPTGPFAHLVLVNGTRLSVLAPTIQDGRLTAQSIFKDTIKVPLSDVAALDIYRSRAVYLSDLKPFKYQYRSYQGEEFGWQADRNLVGRELAVHSLNGPQLFDKGIAVHGECTLSFDLEKKYRRFECLAGLDPNLGRRGNAAVSILVDGKVHKPAEIESITIENAAWPIDVNVAGAKELTLVVKWGEGGNVGDYVNWCDARIFLADTAKK